MSVPVPISSCNVDDLLLHPRFGVEQCKPDGSTKVRAVDNLSWAAMGPESGTGGSSRCKKARKLMSVNGHTVPAEKMHHDTIDDLAVAMSKFVELTGSVPGLIKADIDAAYRRVPIASDHRWACGIVFKKGETVYVSQLQYSGYSANTWKIH